MPWRLWVLVGVVLSGGCAQWPSEQHREVTLTGIERIVEQHQPAIELSCPEVSPLVERLESQQKQLQEIGSRLDELQQPHNESACETVDPDPGSAYDSRVVVGASEWIYLNPPGHHYRARVDSGATTSSLSAQNIVRFERNGDPWVRFDLQHDDENDAIEMERPLVRNVLIRQSSSDETERRPVVEMTVHIGKDLHQVTEFTLTDRSHMSYPILLGRSLLQDLTLIDVGKQFLNEKYQPDSSALVVGDDE